MLRVAAARPTRTRPIPSSRRGWQRPDAPGGGRADRIRRELPEVLSYVVEILEVFRP
jgi:hypothetical protein